MVAAPPCPRCCCSWSARTTLLLPSKLLPPRQFWSRSRSFRSRGCTPIPSGASPQQGLPGSNMAAQRLRPTLPCPVPRWRTRSLGCFPAPPPLPGPSCARAAYLTSACAAAILSFRRRCCPSFSLPPAAAGRDTPVPPRARLPPPGADPDPPSLAPGGSSAASARL